MDACEGTRGVAWCWYSGLGSGGNPGGDAPGWGLAYMMVSTSARIVDRAVSRWGRTGLLGTW